MESQDRYKTILVIVTGLSVIGWIFEFSILGKVAVVIGVVAIFVPPAAKAVEWFWIKLALGLGWINSKILLSIIYFAFVTPIAWISRLFTNDPLSLKRTSRQSLYTSRDHLYSKRDLENTW
jgi:hypothetical protein